jgi:N6-adenosine-specific RNA methylase IME4
MNDAISIDGKHCSYSRGYREYEVHPAASVFPLLEGEAFDALVADIKANGLITAITLLDGRILDGRNRMRACCAAGVEPRCVEFIGDDPIAFIISANIERRHLDESQRAMCAARLATMRQGARTDLAQICAMSQLEAADRMHVSRRLVQSAREVLQRGEPELVRAVDQGAIAVSFAAGLVRQSREIQIEAAEEPARAPYIVRQKLRAKNEAALAERQLALPVARFGVIYADPPWRIEVWSLDTANAVPENHYPTMTVEEIKALDVNSIAANDSVLFLWGTVPMLLQALAVMEAWGFAYKSHFVWGKDRIGTGYWSRNQHEVLLVGTRGNVPAPAPGTQFSSLVLAAVGFHSEKPTAFYELIERYFPHLPKIELFARRRRAGWRVWGAEAPEG